MARHFADVWVAVDTLMAPFPATRKGGILRRGDRLTRAEVERIGFDKVDDWVRVGILDEEDPNAPEPEDNGAPAQIARMKPRATCRASWKMRERGRSGAWQARYRPRLCASIPRTATRLGCRGQAVGLS